MLSTTLHNSVAIKLKVPCLPVRLHLSNLWLRDFAFNNPERLDEILEYDSDGALSTQDIEFLREYTR